MARLTKADRRRAALKGWRNRARKAPKRRNAGKRVEYTVTTSSGSPGHHYATSIYTSFLSKAREEAQAMANTLASGQTAFVERVSPSGKTVVVESFPARRRNPPKGWRPCSAVKITRNKGRIEVRLRGVKRR